VQKRGAAIIEARGLSSAASAANAVIDSVVSITSPTPADDFTSLAVISKGEYGVPEGLQFGFPVRSDGNGGWAIVEGLAHDEFANDRIRVTTEELEAERSDVAALLR
jgi:malate dehydrogenase